MLGDTAWLTVQVPVHLKGVKVLDGVEVRVLWSPSSSISHWKTIVLWTGLWKEGIVILKQGSSPNCCPKFGASLLSKIFCYASKWFPLIVTKGVFTLQQKTHGSCTILHWHHLSYNANVASGRLQHFRDPNSIFLTNLEAASCKLIFC